MGKVHIKSTVLHGRRLNTFGMDKLKIDMFHVFGDWQMAIILIL
jgi:hypothetical protein